VLKKPSDEIVNESLMKYDADYVGFCAQVIERIERTNPGLLDVLDSLRKSSEELDKPGIVLGLQMALLVYHQIEKTNGGSMPIVETREAVSAIAQEALTDPEDFVNKYGTPYFYDGLIHRMTMAAMLADAAGHHVPWEYLVFVVVLMLRLLEVQVELDCKKQPVT
jgi:hypothetical protein